MNDYKNANDIIPEAWVIKSLKMFKVSDKVINFIIKAMKNWKVELITGGQALANQKKHLRGWLTTIFYCNDATQLYT